MKPDIKFKPQYILILLLIVIVSGCKKDFLDIVPKGQLIPQTTSDYRQILDFVSNKNNVGQKVAVLVTYGIVNLLADDYQVSDSAQYKAMITTDRKLWYQWGEEGGYLPDLDDPDWRALYGQIYIMNSCIDGIPNASGSSEEKAALLAEAKFHRAFCYLGLVNIYAKHYTPETAATERGVPLRLGIALTESLARASVKDVYDQVLKDLSEAQPDLKATQGVYNHRPTTAAGYALMARTYLYMGDYEKALENAKASLEQNDFLYNLNEELVVFKTPSTSSTALNAFPATLRSWDDKEILVQKETTYNISLYHFSYATISGPVIWQLYDTTNDLRYRNYFNRVTADGDGYQFRGGYRRWKDAYYYLQVGLSTPEMYLTRAEAYIRTNKVPEGIADINAIRSKRYVTSEYVPLVASDFTQAQALQFVKEERRRELWLRGLRWFDLKRYNALDNANITIERFFTGDKLAPGDEGWVVPIAELYLSQNPEMRLN